MGPRSVPDGAVLDGSLQCNNLFPCLLQKLTSISKTTLAHTPSMCCECLPSFFLSSLFFFFFFLLLLLLLFFLLFKQCFAKIMQFSRYNLKFVLTSGSVRV